MPRLSIKTKPAAAGFLLPEIATQPDPNHPECGHYELLKTHEDGGLEYALGDVLDFTCEEAAFLRLHGVIGEPTARPVTKKRLVMSGCHGCGPTLVTDPPPTL
jgi:hypothetical protein